VMPAILVANWLPIKIGCERIREDLSGQ
jgi:hypothetical protein